ncbi:MAG: tetratricopeptide repeat protein, partial [Deltaproteobacteria bacterium]|nr:tetratricopeptide repeat protein [Deltaproteobacteria bacterium]
MITDWYKQLLIKADLKEALLTTLKLSEVELEKAIAAAKDAGELNMARILETWKKALDSQGLAGWEKKKQNTFVELNAKREQELKQSYDDEIALRLQAGHIERSLFRFDRAVKEYQQARELAEKHFANERLRVATAISWLAMAYQDLGKFDMAREHQEQVVAICEKVLDKDHPDLAQSYHNLAGIYQDLGKLDEALAYQQKAIAIVEKVLDKDHPSLAASYNNLALIYHALGKLDEALAYQQKAIAIQEKVL